MRIAVAREVDPTESRVAATAETVKKMQPLRSKALAGHPLAQRRHQAARSARTRAIGALAGMESKNPNAPAVRQEAEEDWR
jgi:NAD/NADP transhydrogenase alpha subunit